MFNVFALTCCPFYAIFPPYNRGYLESVCWSSEKENLPIRLTSPIY